MKYCSQCGSGMQDGDKFCMNCGNEYAKNGGAKSTVPPVPADQQQHSGQNNVETSQPVVASQIAPQTTPPPRSRRGSGPKTKLILGIILAVVLATGGYWGWNTYGTEARVEKKLDLAVKYISDNNYEQAILAFNDAINIDPKEVQGYQGLAKTYTLQGNYDEARNTYEKGIAAVNPQNKQILQLGLAGMYIDQNKLTDAEQAYSDIINTSPNCPEAYWGLAMVCQKQGDNRKAEAILKQAVEKNPNEYRSYNTLALFLSQNNKKDDALNNIVQSLTLEMNQQEAYLVLDSMYQNNWNELRSQIANLSDQQVAAMLEFYSYYAAGDYPNAINTYQNKLSTQTTNQKAKILAAIAMLKNGDKTSAEALIKQLNVSKLNDWLLSDLGRYYLAAGDQIKARDYALKALQADPTNLDAIALLQSINANDPDAKFYTARALLYNWKPIQRSDQTLLNWNETGQQNNPINAPEKADPNEAGNTAGNIQNGGTAAIQGEWIYYGDYIKYSNGSIEKEYLYKIRTDGTGKVRLNSDYSNNINVVGDWIYYLNHSDGYRLYKIRTDGTERTLLNSDSPGRIMVVGDWIYYLNGIDNGYLYKMRTDGTDKTKLTSDRPNDINVVGDWIYYGADSNSNVSNALYKMRTDGTEKIKVNSDESEYVNVVGDWIYYSSDFSLYKMRTDGTSKTKISSDLSAYINVVGDWIYYGNGNDKWHLYKIRTDGTDKTKLNSDYSSFVNVVGDWIYYSKYNLDSRTSAYYKIRTNGTEDQLIQ